MQDVLTWGALIAAASAIGVWVKFWLDRGQAEGAAAAGIAAAKQSADSALQLANAALAKVEMTRDDFTQARLEIAEKYATHKDLASAEVRLAQTLDSLRVEFAGMNGRLDRLIERLLPRPGD